MHQILPCLSRLTSHYARRFSLFAKREYGRIETLEERVRRVRTPR